MLVPVLVEEEVQVPEEVQEEEPEEEKEKEKEEEEPEEEQEQEPPLWSDQHAAYYSFVTACEEDRRREFRDFVMAANNAAEERAKELSLQTLVTDEYARSFAEAQATAHEELNTARARSQPPGG